MKSTRRDFLTTAAGAASAAAAGNLAHADDQTRISTLEAEIKELEKKPMQWALPRLLAAETPYLLMLIMALIGIAYTSFAGQAIILYWETLAPLYGVACILAGWRRVEGREAHIALIWTQALHWLAILATMALIFAPGVSGVATNQVEALNLMAVLAGGTFIAGVHARAWQICLVGVLLALTVPAMIWVQQSALLLIIGALVFVVLGAALWFGLGSGRGSTPKLS